jgi:hypothetical protein
MAIVYPLKEVLLLVTCATIASCNDFDDIAAVNAPVGARNFCWRSFSSDER